MPTEMTLGNLIQRYEGKRASITRSFQGSRPSIELYEHGVIHHADKQSSTLRWDDIKQIRVQLDDLGVQRMDSSTFAFENTFGEAFAAIVPAMLIQAGRMLAGPDNAALDAGEPITYGPFTLDPLSRLLHLPYGDAILLRDLEIRLPLIEQRFIIFDEQAGAAFDSVAEAASDAQEGDDLFTRPKWFRPYPLTELQPYPRFFAALVHLGIPVHIVGARKDGGVTINYTHEWSR